MRTVQFAVAALLLVAPSAVALAQSNPPDPGKTAPTGVTQQQALYDAGVAGYSMMSGLTKEKDGSWMGEGNKGGSESRFSVDPSGKVTPLP
jgi:opacity protein-like surface antigen